MATPSFTDDTCWWVHLFSIPKIELFEIQTFILVGKTKPKYIDTNSLQVDSISVVQWIVKFRWTYHFHRPEKGEWNPYLASSQERGRDWNTL